MNYSNLTGKYQGIVRSQQIKTLSQLNLIKNMVKVVKKLRLLKQSLTINKIKKSPGKLPVKLSLIMVTGKFAATHNAGYLLILIY